MQIYLKVKGAKRADSSTRMPMIQQLHRQKNRSESIEKRALYQASGRNKRRSSGKVSDARKELADKKAEADQKLADAKKEIDDAKKKLKDGKTELADKEKELNDGKKEVAEKEWELVDAQQQITDGRIQLQSAGKSAGGKRE